MTTGSDRQLHELYWALGARLALAGRGAQAADAYALALYYARRLDDARLADDCRMEIHRCNPRHLAVAEPISAPLFFAQLLIRYPADEAAQMLDELSTESAAEAEASPASESGPSFLAPGESPTAPAWETDPATPARPLFNLTGSAEPATETLARTARTQPRHDRADHRPEPTLPPEFENHHLFRTEETSTAAIDDYLLKEVTGGKPFVSEPAGMGAFINAAAAATCAVGMIAIGFLGVELYRSYTNRATEPAAVERTDSTGSPDNVPICIAIEADPGATDEFVTPAPPDLPRLGMDKPRGVEGNPR